MFAGGAVYTGAESKSVYAVDATNGNLIWTKKLCGYEVNDLTINAVSNVLLECFTNDMIESILLLVILFG